MKFNKSYFIWLLLPLCVSCSSTYHRPASVALCETVDLNGWSKFASAYRIKIQDIEYNLSFNDSQAGLLPTQDNAPVFWIEVWGLTAGQAVGYKTAPMMFSPNLSKLHINGTTVSAIPKIWLGEFYYGRWHPTKEVATPTDLRTGNFSNLRFFMAFPVQRPKPEDKYTIELGEIWLGETKKLIPIEKSCLTPAQTWVEPFRFPIS